jgi:SAM-dependent methyltransferase
MPWLCRFCHSQLRVKFADLGMSPISNNYVSADRLMSMEPFYPLHAYVCENCFLVQLVDFEQPKDLFSDSYAYFSSYSDTWLKHAQAYAAATIEAERLDAHSQVVEIASNDGYLLQYFHRAGIPVLGVEPTANTAAVALQRHGVLSEVAFFGRECAERLAARSLQADVIAANNVLAHVPDINDFVAGYPLLLKPTGVANFEFPHLLRQIEERQFDTIYHEHFSYISFTFATKLFKAHRLRVYDVEELPTHGGSLRLYVCHADCATRPNTPRVEQMLAREAAAGLSDLDTYRRFSTSVVAAKCDLLDFLVTAKRDGKRVAGYGAPAKGNTLLNYCGVGPELVEFTVDRSPHKVGKFLPGVRIPILPPEAIMDRKPDFILILPWNLRDEIMKQQAEIRRWGGRFVTPIPTIQVHE